MIVRSSFEPELAVSPAAERDVYSDDPEKISFS